MAENSEFIVTNDQAGAHSDLGECIIGTRPPYFVSKIHAFRTQDKREAVRIQQETERMTWFRELDRREQLAREAQRAGISVRDLVERDGGTYDEEKDEFRLVAKVPGLNVYLELLGCMESEDSGMERWWVNENGEQQFDRAIDAEAMRQLNRAAVFYRISIIKSRQRSHASMLGDWQPREDWQEQYDPDEFFKRPEKKGIGFDHVDPSRRPASFPKHAFSDDEREEYLRLRTEAEQQAERDGRNLTDYDRANLQHQAAANVAARKLMDE